MNITEEDVRAATAAGIIDEGQAARLTSLAHSRASRIARDLAEDEPFELFRGFAEIFVSVGLILLVSGTMALAAFIGGVFVIAPMLIISCWVAALYFTVNRRMTLPSIVLVSGFSLGVGTFIAWLMELVGLPDDQGWVIALFGLLGIGAMLAYYRKFYVPFAMFVAGLYGLAVVFGVMGTVTTGDMVGEDWETMFDLRQGGSFAIATLVFGGLAFIAGLWFDTRDPHRIGRMARSAFWLHLLAAPALVNTVMMTAFNVQGSTGMVLTIVGLIIITVFALVIDRRSFLTAGLGYLAAVIIWAMQIGDNDLLFPVLMLILGGIVTFLGTFWTQLRVRVMRALPNFPGKDRLPPYEAGV